MNARSILEMAFYYDPTHHREKRVECSVESSVCAIDSQGRKRKNREESELLDFAGLRGSIEFKAVAKVTLFDGTEKLFDFHETHPRRRLNSHTVRSRHLEFRDKCRKKALEWAEQTLSEMPDSVRPVACRRRLPEFSRLALPDNLVPENIGSTPLSVFRYTLLPNEMWAKKREDGDECEDFQVTEGHAILRSFIEAAGRPGDEIFVLGRPNDPYFAYVPVFLLSPEELVPFQRTLRDMFKAGAKQALE